jgi:glycosyltransferase involved in cell wall biosynthesis
VECRGAVNGLGALAERAVSLTVRVCFVYDCLYPFTIGGAERWYRNLAERVATAGHDVTYLTLRQWPEGTDPTFAGVRVVAVGPQFELYREGRRRTLPPVAFGAGVLRHLLGGAAYDVVHTASFPYFSVLAAAAARRRHAFRLFVDWHEVWTRAYWRRYAGPVVGEAGWRIQQRCARLEQRAFCFSRLHASRLRDEGLRGHPVVLEGEYAGSAAAEPQAAEPLVVFAGRHIPEKRVTAIVPAVARARERIPDLRATILGDGPAREEVLRQIAQLGLAGIVEAPGFVDSAVVDAAFGRALCHVLPSEREGYGLVVVEAAARGVPTVVVAGPDNAATEVVSDGENGFIAASASPGVLADAIVRVHDAGDALRGSTLAWYRRNAHRLSLDTSLETVLAAYESPACASA